MESIRGTRAKGVWMAVGLVAAACLPASAQTEQDVSIQISPIFRALSGDLTSFVESGFGAEGQVRYTFSAFSLGVGVEYSHHGAGEGEAEANSSANLIGPFLEPRFVIAIGSESVAPYISGRFAISSIDMSASIGEVTATGYTLNGGGGLLVRLGSRTNLDLGATVGVTDWGSVPNEAGGGDVELGSGSNFVLRVGLGIGVG